MSCLLNVLYCESHHRFEMMIDGDAGFMTLNEDVAGPHHVSKLDSSYVHSGPVEKCSLCLPQTARDDLPMPTSSGEKTP